MDAFLAGIDYARSFRATPADPALDPATVEACAKVAEDYEVTLDEDDPFGNLQIASALRAFGSGETKNK
jgi:hypothetical protein